MANEFPIQNYYGLQKPPLGTLLNTGHYLGKGLLLSYLKNERSGNLIQDSSHNNLPAINNGADWVPEGLSFNGSSDYLSIGDKPSLDITGPYTIVTRINPSGWGGNGFGRIYEKSDNAASGLSFFLRDADDNIRMFHNASTYYETSSNSILLNTNQSIAAVYDGGSVGRIYINAVDKTSDSSVGSVSSAIGNDAEIGRRPSDTTRYFDGIINYLHIYNRALSISEIISIHTNPYQMFRHELIIGEVAAGGITLVISPINQSQAIENLALVQQNTIVVNGSNQAQSIDNIGIVQQNILVINGMDQSQAIDNIDLIQQFILSIQEMSQSQSIDNLDLVQANVLVVNAVDQSQALDNLDLVQQNILAINDTDQNQSIDNINLQTGIVLQISGNSQSQTIDNIDIVQQSTISINGIDQPQSLDNIVLSVGTILQIAEIAQAQNIESINLIQQNILDVAGIDQGQSLEQITLDTGILLQIADIAQNQTLENLDLTQANILDINELLQSQTIDNVIFSLLEGLLKVTFTLKKPTASMAVSKPTANIEIE